MAAWGKRCHFSWGLCSSTIVGTNTGVNVFNYLSLGWVRLCSVELRCAGSSRSYPPTTHTVGCSY